MDLRDPQTVADVLAEVARGAIPAEITEFGTLWRIKAGGLEIVIFNDAGDIDYVEQATAPDGTSVEFEIWFNTHGLDPIDMMSKDDLDRLRSLLP